MKKALLLSALAAIVVAVLLFNMNKKQQFVVPSDWLTYSDAKIGVTFQYPKKLDSEFADFQSVKAFSDASNVDESGCYFDPDYAAMLNVSKASRIKAVMLGSHPFCLISAGDPGAGQLYTSYYYTTSLNGNPVTLDYVVHTPNGCGPYIGTEKEAACKAFFNDQFTAVVTDSLNESAATLTSLK